MKKLSDQALEGIKPDKVKMEICLELKIAYGTFQRWLSKNSKSLTTSETVKAISKHAKISEKNILIES